MSGKSLFITHEHEADGSACPDQRSEHLRVWYLAQGHLDSAPQLSCHLSCLWDQFSTSVGKAVEERLLFSQHLRLLRSEFLQSSAE